MLYTASFDRATISDVRRHIGRCATAVGLTAQRLDDFLIALGEILANAVVHGGGRGEVALRLDGGQVHCVVSDHGTGLPSGYTIGADPDVRALGGRGLWLAHRLCGQLSVRSSAAGTRVELSFNVG